MEDFENKTKEHTPPDEALEEVSDSTDEVAKTREKQNNTDKKGQATRKIAV